MEIKKGDIITAVKSIIDIETCRIKKQKVSYKVIEVHKNGVLCERRVRGGNLREFFSDADFLNNLAYKTK